MLASKVGQNIAVVGTPSWLPCQAKRRSPTIWNLINLTTKLVHADTQLVQAASKCGSDFKIMGEKRTSHQGSGIRSFLKRHMMRPNSSEIRTWLILKMRTTPTWRLDPGRRFSSK